MSTVAVVVSLKSHLQREGHAVFGLLCHNLPAQIYSQWKPNTNFSRFFFEGGASGENEETDKLTLEFAHSEVMQKAENGKNSLEEKVGGLTLSNIKTYKAKEPR